MAQEPDLGARVNDLNAQLTILEQELIMLRGQVRNRDPEQARKMKAENSALQERAGALRRALFLIASDSHEPRQKEQAALRKETLEKAAMEYFKGARISEELWKNLVS